MIKGKKGDIIRDLKGQVGLALSDYQVKWVVCEGLKGVYEDGVMIDDCVDYGIERLKIGDLSKYEKEKLGLKK